jgi:hypothetical protein
MLQVVSHISFLHFMLLVNCFISHVLGYEMDAKKIIVMFSLYNFM